jgi:anaerobic sulfite reductase subunit A
MGYKLSIDQFNTFLDGLKTVYDVYGPAVDPDKGNYSDTDRVTYRKISRFDDLKLKQKSFFSPKEVLFPIREPLFHFSDDSIRVPDIDIKKTAILLRPCDINGFDRLDTVFLNNGPDEDFYYKRRRENVRFFLIECTEGFDSCWCVSMNANKTDAFDVAFRFGNEILADVRNKEFAPYFTGLAPAGFDVRFIEKNTQSVRIPDVGSITADAFNFDMWDEYTSRCIACGRCNTSCITCSCFTMQDTAHGTNGRIAERRRRWAGCQLNGYTDMAGGHSFRARHGEKMRFKTMHKINDFYRRFGKHQCVGCGRCDDVCPQYISFARCINTLSDAVTAKGEK